MQWISQIFVFHPAVLDTRQMNAVTTTSNYYAFNITKCFNLKGSSSGQSH